MKTWLTRTKPECFVPLSYEFKSQLSRRQEGDETSKRMANSQVSVGLPRLHNIYSKVSIPGDIFLITLGPIHSHCSHFLNESTFYQAKQSLVEHLNLLYNYENLKIYSTFGLIIQLCIYNMLVNFNMKLILKKFN